MRNERLLLGLALAAACGVVALAVFRIQTYVCAQDSATYINLAKAMLHEAPGSPAWIKAMTFVAPVYPLGLALAMKLGGEFAPYWVNPVLGLVLLAVYAAVLRVIFGGPRAAAVALLASLYILMTGYSLNPHFLFYAFRELPSLLLLLIGMGLLLAGRNSGWAWVFALAGLSFLLAAGVREPSVCGIAGPALWLITSRDLAGPRKRRAVLAFVVPFLLVLAAGVAAAMAADIAVNKQMVWWTRRFVDRPLMQTLWGIRLSAVGQARFLGDEMGWAGLALGALGVWKLRRNRAAMFFFLATAVFFYLFYCSYIPHRRYFLAVLFFACPFVGYGLHAVLEWAREGIRRLAGRDVGGTLHVAACAALAVVLAARAAGLEPWGPRVTRAELIAFREAADRLNTPSARFFVERKCNDLGAALSAHTDVKLGDTKELADLSSGAARPHYRFFKPLNDACFIRGLVRDWGARVEEMLLAQGDLVPVRNVDGHPVEIALAAGRYAVLQSVPWSRRSVEDTVDVNPATDTVLWLDFRASGACRKSVALLGPDGAEWHRWDEVNGDGIRGFFVPGRAIRGAQAVVAVDSECPIPGRVVVAAVPWHKSVRFDQMADRRISCSSWFEPPFIVGSVDGRFGVLTKEGGCLRMPVPRGGDYKALQITFLLGPYHRRDQQVNVVYRLGSEPVLQQSLDLTQYEEKHTLVMPRPESDELVMDIRVDPPAEGDAFVCVHEIRMEIAAKPMTGSR